MKRVYITAFAILMFAAACCFSHSCANTTTPPSGGPKDTLPPVLIKLAPDNGTTLFPRTEGKIILQYNEYTVVKNPTEILASPPGRRAPQAKVKGKNIVVTFQDTLKENQTYTIDFGNALADNNEGNLAPRLVYAFSTGETVDSLYFTGKVFDSQTLSPVKGALVAAFTDQSDSACFNHYPDAVVKTDDWGFFVLRNLRDTAYALYVYTDTDNDYKYNPDEDMVAFLDSAYVPTAQITDSTYELRSFVMKDTAACEAREAMLSLYMFKELQTVQYLQNSGRHTERQGYLKFSAADVQINSLTFVGLDSSAVIIQYNRTRDSLDFWINTDYRLDDSLLVRVNYMKTDSTGVLSPFEESLSLAIDKDTKDDSRSLGGKGGKKQADTTFVITLDAKDETVEQLGVKLSSALPVIQVNIDSLRLVETNPKGQTSEKKFSFKQDSSDIRNYIITPSDPLLKGYDYELVIPRGTFVNLDKLPNAKASAKFKIPQGEDLSTLLLALEDVEGRYIVELTDEKGQKALRTYNVEEPCTLQFPYLKAGSYMVRVTSDQNRNGFADTGNLLERKQPEVVRFYESSEGSRLLTIPESSEVEQTVNLKSMFQ